MKRLFRSRKDRIISGVCGGFAEYIGVDPSMMRLGWVFFTIFGGSGILAYILAIIIIPDELSITEVEKNPVPDPNTDKKVLWGILLTVVGLILFFVHSDLLHMIWSKFWDSGFNILISVIIFSIGVYLLYKNRSLIAEILRGSHDHLFHLSKNNAMISGVCGGIAESLAIDSSLVRFLWLFGTVMSLGIGFVVYIILALVLPSATSEPTVNN